MTDVATVRRTYPWTTNVDGVRLTFRLMEPSDRDAILEFARSLPNDDLMFLRTDITQPKTVDAWINYIKTGRTITVVAEADGKIGGYASIHLNDALWTRHVGELRVLVARDFRGLGLGKRLTNEAFAIAKDLSLKKITARLPTGGAARGPRDVSGRADARSVDHVVRRVRLQQRRSR